MPGEPVREREFHEADGEIGQALAEFLHQVGRLEHPDRNAAAKARIDNIRLTPTLLSWQTTKALAVVNYWLDRNNLRAAMFWLNMVISQLPASYSQKVQAMDRFQVDAEIEAWGRKLGYTPAEAKAVAARLLEGVPAETGGTG